MGKNPPARQETWVRPLGQEDPLAEESKYSCLENSMDREVWWATVHRIAKESGTTEQLIHTHMHTRSVPETTIIF